MVGLHSLKYQQQFKTYPQPSERNYKTFTHNVTYGRVAFTKVSTIIKRLPATFKNKHVII